MTPVGGGEERVMGGARGVGEGEIAGVGVGVGVGIGVGIGVGVTVVDGSHEMEDGGSPVHSCISLMNSQSVS